MKKILPFFVFLVSIHGIGQETDLKKLRQSNNLEAYTYSVLDEFLKNPSEETLKSLPKSFWRNPVGIAEKLALVILFCNRAYYENLFGKTSAAIESYEKAWRIFDKNKLNDYDIIEFCLKPLGNLYTVLGDYDNAENTIKQYYYSAIKQQNQPHKIAAIVNLSNVYQSSGRAGLSIDLLENAQRSEKLSSAEKARILNNLGSSYIALGDFQKAEKALTTAVKLLKKNKGEPAALANSYRNLSVIASEKGDFKNAGIYFKKAEPYFFVNGKPEPRKLAKWYYDKALLDFRQGKTGESIQKLQLVFQTLIPGYTAKKAAVPDKNSLYPETVLLDALDFQAVLLSTQKQYAKALEFYALSFHIEELFSPLLLYENTRLLTQARNRKRTEKCILLYEVLYRKDFDKKWIESAFLLSEKTKSGVLKAHLSHLKLISPKEKLILKQFQDWNNLIVREQQKFEKANLTKINEAIAKQNDLAMLLKTLRAEDKTDATPLSMENLYRKLHKDQARLLSYFAGLEKTYAFSVDTISVKMQVLDKSANARILDFISYFDHSAAIPNDIQGYRKSAFELYSLLKIPPKTQTENLIVIPDGLLNFVSFEALLTQNSTLTDFSKMPYLLKDYKIGYNNSVAFYMDRTPFNFDNETVLGVFPIFEGTPLELPFSRQESAAIRHHFKGEYLKKQQAGFKDFTRRASAFSILHLSTHASAGDLETPATIRFYDREVLYSELYNLDLHPDLVVLSACETGIGKLYKGEGAMSVARGFQFSGAKNLLFSLWKVNDFTTSVVMADFYKNIKKGHSYFNSNYLSKINYLDNDEIPNTKKSPYYWSAMIYHGTLENKPASNYLWIFWVIIIAIALFLVYRKLIRKNGQTARFPQ